MKSKLDPVRSSTDMPTANASAEAWALSSQSIVCELNQMHAAREDEKTKKEENSSLFKNMGPSQRTLFTTLSTNDMEQEPIISEFMKDLMPANAPQKAIALLRAETRDWEGTFSDSCVHRFL